MIDFESLDQEDKDELISTGIAFMQSITRLAGPEDGMELWNQINEVLGDDIKGAVFFHMLMGGGGNFVSFTAGLADSRGNAVATIKCIRTYTGQGLKEAKDNWDASKTSRIRIKCDYKSRNQFAKELRDLGCNVI